MECANFAFLAFARNTGMIAQGFPGCPFLVVPEMGAVQDKIYRENVNCRQKSRGRGTGLPGLCGFFCKAAFSRSGRCWFRTSDLCRVKGYDRLLGISRACKILANTNFETTWPCSAFQQIYPGCCMVAAHGPVKPHRSCQAFSAGHSPPFSVFLLDSRQAAQW